MRASNSTSAGRLIFNRGWWLVFLVFGFLPGSGLAQLLKVERIVLHGRQAFSEGQLKEILKSREGRPFNAKFMKLDQILLVNYYQLHGYLDVFVSSDFKRDGEKITIVYTIREGRRYFLRGIAFRGNRSADERVLRRFFDIKPGDPYQPTLIEKGLNAVEAYYLDRGKLYVRLQPERNVVQDSLIDLIIHIQENETVYIEDIQYFGLRWVKEFIIRRELEIQKGDRYSRRKLELSQRNIYGTGLFKSVNFKLDPIDDSRSRVRLKIFVVEKRPRWLGVRFGVTYEEEKEFGRATSTFDITAQAGHRNLFGTARSLSISLIPSFLYDVSRGKLRNPKNQIRLTFVEPWIGYTRTPGIFQFAYSEYRKPIYPADLTLWTASFNVRHAFPDDWSVEGMLSARRVNTRLDTLLQKLTQGQDLIYAFSFQVIRDHRDNYLSPQDGSLLEFRSKVVYSTILDMDTGRRSINRFIKVTAQWNRYQPVPRNPGWVLASRLRAGAIVEFKPATRIPFVERFFLGGASSVRGYAEQLLGPVVYDTRGHPVPLGGKALWLSNVELRIPLFWLLYGEIFLDGGYVWAELREVRLLDLKFSTGLGLALMTPVGPVRLDYGYKLTPQPGERRYEIHLGISFAF